MAVYGLSRALLPHVFHAVTAINGGLRLEQGAPFVGELQPPGTRRIPDLEQFADTLTVLQVCRVTRATPFSAKRRPKFISVTVSGVRL